MTKFVANTTTVDRELIAVNRAIHRDEKRVLGGFHATQGHRGSAARCRLCRDELHRRRETIFTEAEATEAGE